MKKRRNSPRQYLVTWPSGDTQIIDVNRLEITDFRRKGRTHTFAMLGEAILWLRVIGCDVKFQGLLVDIKHPKEL